MVSSAAPPVAAVPELEARERRRDRLVRPMPADGVWGWLLPLAVTAVAAALRFWRLGRPSTVVFDETYYEHDAWNLFRHGVELDVNSHDRNPGFVVHPPLGKWFIAAGEGMFGHDAWGWRFAAAVVGSLSVLVIARVARRLFRSTALGVVAGLLLTFDGLAFVQSRVAMLDVFLMFWVLAAFGCLVVDRDDGRRRLAARLDTGGRFGPRLGWRRWRWAAAGCLGAAVATKWSGIFWIPVLLVLALAWDWGARRTAGVARPARATLARSAVPAAAVFLVIPAAVYVASWTGWFLSDGAHAYGHDRYVAAGQSWFTHGRAVLGGWLRYHWEIYQFHANLDAAHPYLSRPYGWLLLARPVAYFYASPHGCGADACSQEVLGVGTPALWWASIPALVVMLGAWIGRRDWRAGAILLSFLAGYLPWFVEDAQHRTMFLFYLLPAVPFMVLAVTLTLGIAVRLLSWSSWARTTGVAIATAYLLAVVGNFAYLYPVLSGKTISYDQWRHRMWLDTCDTSKHRNQHHENAPCWI